MVGGTLYGMEFNGKDNGPLTSLPVDRLNGDRLHCRQRLPKTFKGTPNQPLKIGRPPKIPPWLPIIPIFRGAYPSRNHTCESVSL